MTADITLASSGGDSAVLETITQYQAALLGAGALKTTAFQTAAAGGEDTGPARTALSAWIESRLVPYLRAEADVLIPALEQTAAAGILREELSAGTAELLESAERMTASTRTADTGAAAAALQILLAEHFELESRRVLPALAEASRIDLAELWSQVIAAGGDGDNSNSTAQETAKHVCECGILDDEGFPELDVREVPHAIRHATVFGALDAVEKGSGLVLVAPHDPLPLLAQIEARTPGEFAVEYLDRGPETWRLQFLRAGAVS